MNIPHEHDEDGNCIPPKGYEPASLPTWRLSLWDIVGITAAGAAGLFSVASQTFNLYARECAAMANWERRNYDLAIAEAQRQEAMEAHLEQQRQLSETLDRMVNGGEES